MAEETDLEIAKVQQYIKEQVQANVAEMRAAETQQNDRLRTERSSPTGDTNQLKEILDPYIKPDMDRLRLEASAIRDEATFYRKTAEAGDYEEQIESTFKQLVDAGRPMARADIYRYLVGKMAVDEPDKFTERQTSRKARQLETASGAIDLGFNGAGRQEEVDKFKAFDKLTVEEMERALDGVVF